MLKTLTEWITTNWKVLQEMEIPDHLTCHLRNLYAGQACEPKAFSFQCMTEFTTNKKKKERKKKIKQKDI